MPAAASSTRARGRTSRPARTRSPSRRRPVRPPPAIRAAAHRPPPGRARHARRAGVPAGPRPRGCDAARPGRPPTSPRASTRTSSSSSPRAARADAQPFTRSSLQNDRSTLVPPPLTGARAGPRFPGAIRRPSSPTRPAGRTLREPFVAASCDERPIRLVRSLGRNSVSKHRAPRRLDRHAVTPVAALALSAAALTAVAPMASAQPARPRPGRRRRRRSVDPQQPDPAPRAGLRAAGPVLSGILGGNANRRRLRPVRVRRRLITRGVPRSEPGPGTPWVS